MPKMKSNSAAKKVFRSTGKGKVVHRQANSGHFKIKKSGSRKRRLAHDAPMKAGELKKVRRLVPYL